MSPVVEVVILAYNQEHWIEQTLRSVLMQRTDFPIAIRLHDDASTDDTVAVARRVLEGAELAWTIETETENQYRQGMNWWPELLAKSEAEFIAILDGDDYWLAEDKLQRQVDQLRANPEAALSHHEFLFDRGGELEASTWPSRQYRVPLISGNKLVEGNFMTGSTVMFRRELLPTPMPEGYDHLRVWDFPIWALVSLDRKIAYIAEPLGAYRVHDSSVFTSAPHDVKWLQVLDAFSYLVAAVPPSHRKAWQDGLRDFVSETYYQLSERVEALETSTSWRITAPLRGVSALMRRLRSIPSSILRSRSSSAAPQDD